MATAAGVKDKHQVALLIHVVKEVAGLCPDIKQLPEQLLLVSKAAEVQVCSSLKLAHNVACACPHAGSHIRIMRLYCAMICWATLCWVVLCCDWHHHICFATQLAAELGRHGVRDIQAAGSKLS